MDTFLGSRAKSGRKSISYPARGKLYAPLLCSRGSESMCVYVDRNSKKNAIAKTRKTEQTRKERMKRRHRGTTQTHPHLADRERHAGASVAVNKNVLSNNDIRHTWDRGSTLARR